MALLSIRHARCEMTATMQLSPVSVSGDEVIMSIAGHVSRAMLSRYSHVRMEAKRSMRSPRGRVRTRSARRMLNVSSGARWFLKRRYFSDHGTVRQN